MTNLLLTVDQHYMDDKKYSFIVFDPYENIILHKVPYVEELNCPQYEFEGSNRPGFRPFGITKTEKEIFVASNANIVAFDINTYEFNRVVSTDGVVNTHQILADDGYIYRTNTSNDTISRIDINSLETVHYDVKNNKVIKELIQPKDYIDMDDMHINSLFAMPSSLFFIANNCRKRNSELYILEKDFSRCEKVADLGKHCHELIPYGNSLYTFSSVEGKMIKIDFSEMSIVGEEIVDPDQYFLRGAALIDGEIFIFANQLKTKINGKAPVKLLSVPLDSDEILECEVPDFAIIAAATTI